jgi:hypothetical protein
MAQSERVDGLTNKARTAAEPEYLAHTANLFQGQQQNQLPTSPSLHISDISDEADACISDPSRRRDMEVGSNIFAE